VRSVGAVVGWLLGGDWGLGLGLVLFRSVEEEFNALVGVSGGPSPPPRPSCAFCQAKKSRSSCISDCVGAAVGLEGFLVRGFDEDPPLGAVSLAGRSAAEDGRDESDGLGEGAALGAAVCVGLLVGLLVGAGDGLLVGRRVGVLVEGLLVKVG
jgi:hypothetical protein